MHFSLFIFLEHFQKFRSTVLNYKR